MEIIAILIAMIIIILLVEIYIVVNRCLTKISNSLDVICYIIENHNVNLDNTKDDIDRIAREVTKNKSRIKKLEMNSIVSDHKLDNMHKELNAYSPITRSNKLQ